MSWLTFIKGLLAAPKAIETGAEIAKEATTGIINGMDAIIYSKEEKAKDYKELVQEAQTTIMHIWNTFRDENSVRSITRRRIAVALTCLYIGVILIGLLLLALSGLPPLEILKMMQAFLENMYFVPFIGAVMASYFVPYQLSHLFGGGSQRNGNNKGDKK